MFRRNGEQSSRNSRGQGPAPCDEARHMGADEVNVKAADEITATSSSSRDSCALR